MTFQAWYAVGSVWVTVVDVVALLVVSHASSGDLEWPLLFNNWLVY